MARKKRSKIVCPKCGKPPYALREVWVGHTIEFNATKNGLYDGKDGYLKPGYPNGVDAKCECGHWWKLRGITQITEIISE